jgi:hypothetical protein
MYDFGPDFYWRAVFAQRPVHADLSETRIRRETGRIAKDRLQQRSRTDLYAGANRLVTRLLVNRAYARRAYAGRAAALPLVLSNTSAHDAARKTSYTRFLIAARPLAGRGRRGE